MGGFVSSILSRQVASSDPSKNEQSGALQSRGQMGGRSCEWLKAGSDIEGLSGKLSHLNMQEKASLKDLGKAALLTKAKLDNGPGLLTRLCVWMEAKFGDYFPSLKGYKADLDRSIAEDQKELAQFDNQYKQYERMNELRGMTPREIEGLMLSAEEKNTLKDLLVPSEKEENASLNEFLVGMREGQPVSEPLLLGDRIDQVEALLAKHERGLELAAEVGGILKKLSPDKINVSGKIEYCSYDMLAKSYAANKADALEALEGVLRESLFGSASQYSEDELRQILIASASNKEDELLLCKLMIDIRHGITNGPASEYKGSGDDPLRQFVQKPLRQAVGLETSDGWKGAIQQYNKTLENIDAADFLSVTNNPKACLKRATDAAGRGATLMEHWLFLASDAVHESDSAEIAKKFDGGKALVSKTGSRWFEGHEASLMRYTNDHLLNSIGPLSDGDHKELGDDLEKSLRHSLLRLNRKLTDIAGSVSNEQGDSSVVQKFAGTLLQKLKETTGGIDKDGNINFPKLAEHLGDHALLSLPKTLKDSLMSETYLKLNTVKARLS